MEYYPIYIVAILASTMVPNPSVLTGYDCTQPSEVTPVDLTTIKACQTSKKVEARRNVTIQLVQKTRFVPVPYFQCSVAYLQHIRPCEMTPTLDPTARSSRDVLYHGTTVSVVRDLDHLECRDLMETRKYNYSGKWLEDVKINASSSYHVTEAGSVDENGLCKEGGYYNFGGNEYTDVLATTQITIHLRNGWATLDLEEEEIILPSGVRCKSSAEVCIDKYGATFWNKNSEDECTSSSYQVVYEGESTAITGQDPLSGLVYHKVVIDDGNQVFAVPIKSSSIFCNHIILQTKHPRLFVALPDVSAGFLFKYSGPIYPLEVDLKHFLSIERHIQNEMEKRYSALKAEQCMMAKWLLEALFTLAPMEFAFEYTGRVSGYSAIEKEEVVYLIKCIQTEVTFRETADCYEEIPVYHLNEPYFLKSRSKVITKVGTLIPCLGKPPKPYTPNTEHVGGIHNISHAITTVVNNMVLLHESLVIFGTICSGILGIYIIYRLHITTTTYMAVFAELWAHVDMNVLYISIVLSIFYNITVYLWQVD